MSIKLSDGLNVDVPVWKRPDELASFGFDLVGLEPRTQDLGRHARVVDGIVVTAPDVRSGFLLELLVHKEPRAVAAWVTFPEGKPTETMNFHIPLMVQRDEYFALRVTASWRGWPRYLRWLQCVWMKLRRPRAHARVHILELVEVE